MPIGSMGTVVTVKATPEPDFEVPGLLTAILGLISIACPIVVTAIAKAVTNTTTIPAVPITSQPLLSEPCDVTEDDS